VQVVLPEGIKIILRDKGDAMDILTLINFLVIGGITGWLTGKYMYRMGLSISENIFIGIAGGIIGGYLFRILVFAAGGLIGSMVTAGAGAMVLLYTVGLYKKTKKA
jgi:uncharacterized membrane protein YeaQ/YmgE (transglycosylase-associated protein family)